MQDAFYDALAPYNHLLFARWEQFQTWQRDTLSAFLPAPGPNVHVVDLACGIGTQLLPFKAAGYTICGIDSAEVCVERSRQELATRGLHADVRPADVRHLAAEPATVAGGFDVALLLDNYITHAASDDEALAVMRSVRHCLKGSGIALIAVRDYDESAAARPTGTMPAFYLDEAGRRIVHQVWDWQDDGSYELHLHIAMATGDGTWCARHFVGRLRPVRRARLVEMAREAGFGRVELCAPSQIQYHQWILRAFA